MKILTKVLILSVRIFNKFNTKDKCPYTNTYYVSGNEVGMYEGSCKLIKKLSVYGIYASITTHGFNVYLLRGQAAVLKRFMKEEQAFILRTTDASHKKITL